MTMALPAFMCGTAALRHVKVAVEIGFQRAVEVLFGEVFELVHVLLKCRVVDENIELAEFARPSLHGALAEFGIGDVA